VSVREFCISRAAECLLASEQVSLPSDREALLHMAASYFARAIDIDLREAQASGKECPEGLRPQPREHREGWGLREGRGLM
jgi:hypothetical protein